MVVDSFVMLIQPLPNLALFHTISDIYSDKIQNSYLTKTLFAVILLWKKNGAD